MPNDGVPKFSSAVPEQQIVLYGDRKNPLSSGMTVCYNEGKAVTVKLAVASRGNGAAIVLCYLDQYLWALLHAVNWPLAK